MRLSRRLCLVEVDAALRGRTVAASTGPSKTRGGGASNTRALRKQPSSLSRSVTFIGGTAAAAATTDGESADAEVAADLLREALKRNRARVLDVFSMFDTGTCQAEKSRDHAEMRTVRRAARRGPSALSISA